MVCILLFYAADSREHMDFFGFSPRKDVKRDRYSIFIHEEPHPYDRVRAVVLFRAPCAQLILCLIPLPIDRVALFIKGIQVRAANVKVIVRAVKVRNGQVARNDALGIVKYPFLKFLALFIDKIKARVNVIQRKTAKFLKMSYTLS